MYKYIYRERERGGGAEELIRSLLPPGREGWYIYDPYTFMYVDLHVKREKKTLYIYTYIHKYIYKYIYVCVCVCVCIHTQKYRVKGTLCA